MGLLKRSISLILIFALLLQMLPIGVIAAETGEYFETYEEMTSSEADVSKAEDAANKHVVGEVTDRRDASEKHFLMTDGSFLAVMYGNQVHYQDDAGQWQEYDNTLTLKTVDDASILPPGQISLEEAGTRVTVYETANGKETRQFAASLDAGGYIFTAAHADMSVSMSVVRENTLSKNDTAMGPDDPDAGDSEAAFSISARVNNPTDRRDKLTVEEWQKLPIEEQVEIDKHNAGIEYKNVWEGVDLSYQVSGADVKESIVITAPQEQYDYVFRLTTNGLDAKLSDGGVIELVDSEGKAVFQIPAPFMEAADGATSDAVKYLLEKDETGYLLRVSADSSWINSEERKFPVVIDPSIISVTFIPNNSIITSYVCESRPTSAAPYNTKYLRSGYYTNTSSQVENTLNTVGLIYINRLPTIPKRCEITDASLVLSQVYYDGSGSPSTHKLYATTISTPSDPKNYLGQMRWNTYLSQILPNYAILGENSEATAIDYAQESGTHTSGQEEENSPRKTKAYNITAAAQSWYGNSQYTLSRLLVLDDGHSGTSTNARVTYAGYCFANTEYATGPNMNYYPALMVSYRDTTGLDSIYGYHTQDIGRAGTGYVSDYTLNSTIAVPITSSPSETLPFTLSLIYNIGLSNNFFSSVNGIYTQSFSDMKIGYGWKLSAQETIDYNSTLQKCIYIDADGTEHFFKKIGADYSLFQDEDGLGLVIVKNSLDYTMTDVNGNTWVFVHGYLTSYTTADGNALYYAYDGHDYNPASEFWKPTSASPQLTSIWRQNNGCSYKKLVTISYNASNYLSVIKDAADRETSFTYTGSTLTKITFPDGKTASYTYTQSASGGYQRIYRVTDDEAGYRIQYTYRANRPLQVAIIREFVCTGNPNNEADWELGQRVNCFQSNATYSRFRYFDAGDPEPTTADPGGRMVTRHYFDSYGRTINVLTMNAEETKVLGVDTGTYTENSETSKKNNRLTSYASLGVQSRNLLNNSGLELTKDNLSCWNSIGRGTVNRIESLGQYLSHTGVKMMKLTAGESGETIFRQSVTLKGNTTYVLSAYVNTAMASAFTPAAVYLKIAGDVSSGGEALNCSWYSAPVDYITSNLINLGWKRVECAFRTESAGRYWVGAAVTDGVGNILVDDFQLEEVLEASEETVEQGTASSLDLVQLNGFEDPEDSNPLIPKVEHWWSWSTDDGVSISTKNRESGITGHSLKFLPNASGKVRATQVIKINDVAAKTYLLSAWGLTPPTNYNDDKTMEGNNSNDARFFGVIAKVTYQNSAYDPDYYYMKFNGSISEWQYATLAIVPKQAENHPDAIVSTITICPALDHGVNTVYFDDISLRQEPIQTYDYDNDGNLVSATNSEGKTETEYDDSNRLTKYTNMAGVEYALTYTGDSRNPESITSDGVTTSYTYNAAGSITQTKTKGSTAAYLQSNAAYDTTGNFQESTTDTADRTVTRSYNVLKGTLSRSITPTSDGGTVTTNYIYNSNNDRPTSTYQTGVAALNYSYGADGSLESLTRKSFTGQAAFWQKYAFQYDDWGRTTAVRVQKGTDDTGSTWSSGTQLASYTYNTNGTMATMTYPNGDYVAYGYDTFDRLVSEVYYNSSNVPQVEYRYVYNAEGKLAKQYEVRGNTTQTYTFMYDSLGRLIRSNEANGGSTLQRTEHLYDTANRLTAQNWTVGSRDFGETYTYDADDGSLTQMRAASQDFLNYSYDSLKRLTGIQVVWDDADSYHPFDVTQSYVNLGSNRTTTQIKYFNYRKPAGTLISGNKYEYDAAGNISQICESEAPYRVLSAYTYDVQNQLTQEVRYTYTGTSTTPSSTVTTNYTYDTAGNIRSVSEQTNNDAAVTTNYAYGNSDWADLLTSYDGHTISYSGGNPTNWYNGESYSDLTWEQGRRLSSVTKGTGSDVTSISYTYDMSGIRSSKTVSGVTHNYVTQSGRVVRESYDNRVLDFFYDANGRPFALDYSTNNGTNFTKYYYVLNAQGDVVGLMDRDGNLIVKYAYDAWGKLVSVVDATGAAITASTHIANINPLRYRGYYYDADTEWYYLQSRYYDPIVKRFLNTDSYSSTGQGFLGYNMFAYCNNAPQNRIDKNGQLSESDADELIVSLSDYIFVAAAEYGVDPVIIACCIYVEQTSNVNWVDGFDSILYFLDTSIGVGQVRVSTARMLEDEGYISESVGYTEMIITWTSIEFIYHSRNSIIASKLEDPKTNIRYVAAYLKFWQDQWRPTLDISNRADILCTLYNLGDKANAPNASPKPNEFGINASQVYSHIYIILYG